MSGGDAVRGIGTVRGLRARLERLPVAGPPGWQRPEPDAAARRADLLLGVLLAVAGILTIVLGRSAGIAMEHRPAVGEEIAWVVAVSLPLVVRRRYPQTVLVLVAVAFIGLGSRGVVENFASQIGLFLAVFTVGAWGRERVLSRWTRGIVVAVMFGWLVYGLSTASWDSQLSDHRPDGPLPAVLAIALLTAIVNVVYFGAAWALGELAWRSAAQQALLEQRAVELARERDENARRAVLDERVRIARELHDVVAHHVSVMGVQAGAARVVLDADPAAARTALGGIEQAARQAVEEMRRLLGVLRASPGPDGSPVDGGSSVPPLPAPGLDDLPGLVTATAAAGPTAEFTVVGTPVPVPSGLSVSVYRIVQEALTNTVRHAGAARVDVRLRYLTEPGPAVEAEVVDDGRARPVPTGRGLGLVGMRERAALHDGELETGPRPGGGYRVRARFPLGEGRRPDPAARPAPGAARDAALEAAS